MAYYIHLKCTDDQAEWQHEKTPQSEVALQAHYNFVNGSVDERDTEAAWMKCPTCNKNWGHEITVVEEQE